MVTTREGHVAVRVRRRGLLLRPIAEAPSQVLVAEMLGLNQTAANQSGSLGSCWVQEPDV